MRSFLGICSPPDEVSRKALLSRNTICYYSMQYFLWGDSNAFYGSSQGLPRVMGKPPMSHRSISFTPIADTATGDVRYCSDP